MTEKAVKSKPLGTGRDWRRRLLLHHVPLALASAAVLSVWIALPLFRIDNAHGDLTSGSFPQATTMGSAMGMARATAASLIRQSTVATGYLALGLLALTLLVGPANLLLRRRNPVSSSLRRDIGTWTVAVSAAHVILGFNVHGTGQILDYFIRAGRPLLNSFGLANWTGLAALVSVVGLLAISTDRALQELKARTWKRVQRLNYTVFALVILHAFFYGALLRLTSPFTVLLIFTVVSVAAGQAMGIVLWRHRARHFPPA
jgi:sulfoxide reductase heme-binding subunit YedZ